LVYHSQQPCPSIAGDDSMDKLTVIALAVLVWRFVHYLLEGGRVRVRIRPAQLTDWGTLMTGAQSGWTSSDVARLSPRGRHNVELAHVVAVAILFRALDATRERGNSKGDQTLCPRIGFQPLARLGDAQCFGFEVGIRPLERFDRLVDKPCLHGLILMSR
jgi:hypothetical protein